MANTSSLLALANGVRVYMASVNPSVTVAVTGWKQRAQHLNQGAPGANRILLIPGDLQGRDGKLDRELRNTGRNPRVLITWERLVTMSVWACDTSQKDSDEAQIVAVENLLEQAIQAVHTGVDPDTKTPVGLANITWGSVRWTVANQEMAFGREVLVDFTQQAVFLDRPNGVAFPSPVLTPRPIVP